MMNIASRLLTYDQLGEIYRNEEKPTPYVIKHINNRQLVVFIGFNHSNNPKDKSFRIIKQEWQIFIRETEGREQIVLSEGGVRPVVTTEDEAIKRFGESGLLAFWSYQEDIPIATPEPPNYSDVQVAAQNFPVEAVAYYLFARQISQWHRTELKSEFQLSMQDTLNHYQDVLSWDFDFSFDNLVKIHERLYKKPFNLNDAKFFHDQSDPTKEETAVQQVARTCSRARDEYISKQFLRYWEEGKCIFSVYGSAHVYVIEPIISTF